MFIYPTTCVTHIVVWCTKLATMHRTIGSYCRLIMLNPLIYIQMQNRYETFIVCVRLRKLYEKGNSFVTVFTLAYRSRNPTKWNISETFRFFTEQEIIFLLYWPLHLQTHYQRKNITFIRSHSLIYLFTYDPYLFTSKRSLFDKKICDTHEI